MAHVTITRSACGFRLVLFFLRSYDSVSFDRGRGGPSLEKNLQSLIHLRSKLSRKKEKKKEKFNVVFVRFVACLLCSERRTNDSVSVTKVILSLIIGTLLHTQKETQNETIQGLKFFIDTLFLTFRSVIRLVIPPSFKQHVAILVHHQSPLRSFSLRRRSLLSFHRPVLVRFGFFHEV